MKTKKILAALLAAGILMSFAACSGGSTSSQGTKETGSSMSSQASSVDMGMGKQVFGKVNSIAGNEVKLSMAEMPAPPETESGAGAPKGDGNMVAAVEMVPATEVQEGAGEAVERPKLELEYTGQEEDFIIPAGVEIYGMDGKPISMEDIKKGSVLMLNLDGAGTVVSVSIWE